jgi:hypothetical protein
MFAQAVKSGTAGVRASDTKTIQEMGESSSLKIQVT